MSWTDGCFTFSFSWVTLLWCFSWILMSTPFKGSLSMRWDDVRNLRKPLVSIDSLFPTYTCQYSSFFSFIVILYLPFLNFIIHYSAFLEQEISRSISPPMRGLLPPPCPTPSAPQPRELITIEEESERLARELKEVSPLNKTMLRSLIDSVFSWEGPTLLVNGICVCFLLGVKEQRQSSGSADAALSIQRSPDQDTLSHSLTSG